MPKRFSSVTVSLWIGAGILLCAAVCLFAVSTRSFQELRAVALSAIPPGYEERFTFALFLKIITGLRFLGAALTICALILILFAERLSRLLLYACHDLQEFAEEIWNSVSSLRRGSRLHTLALAAIVIWGIALRLDFFSEPIRNDEAYSFMHYASRPIYVGLTYYTVNNHILNTLLMHISAAIFGASLWAIRLPTLIAGILIIPAAYLTVRLFQGPEAALLAAALASASSPLIEYSFNARGYSLGALFFLIAIIIVGFGTRSKSRAAWIILPIPAALALYSVPTMVYGIAGLFVYLLQRRSELRWTCAAIVSTGILTLLLYSPVLVTVGLSAITSNQWVAPLQRDVWLQESAREIASLWRYWNLDLPPIAGAFIAVGALLAVIFVRVRRTVPIAILIYSALVGCAFMAIHSVVIPRRSSIFLLPLYFGAAGIGWSTVTRKLPGSRSLLVALSLAISGWMGYTVCMTKSLRHSGIEAAGPRSVESIVLNSRQELLEGAQFICSDYFDSGLDFEMRVHHIPYRPSASGELLIVTPAGASAQRTLQLAGISDRDVLSVHKIAHYSDADEYEGRRGPSLAFAPRGTTEMGVFTENGY